MERDCLGWKAHSGGGKGGHVEAEHEVPEKFIVRSKSDSLGRTALEGRNVFFGAG